MVKKGEGVCGRRPSSGGVGVKSVQGVLPSLVQYVKHFRQI